MRNNVIRLANDFILHTEVFALPLKIEDLECICDKLGYVLVPYQAASDILKQPRFKRFATFAAFTYISEDCKLVLFDSTKSIGTRIFAIAHEIGHIVLKHNYSGAVGYSQADSDQENEANTFAYQLLAPLCVLHALGIKKLRDIENCTLLDREHAKVIHSKLLRYREQHRADEMINAYRVLIPRHGSSFAVPLVLAVTLLFSIAMVKREIPQSKDTVAPAVATNDFFSALKQRTTTDEVLASIPSTENTGTVTTGTPEQGETVYITRSGERYHKQNCYHIKNSTTVTAVPLSEAVGEGYTACKSCY